MFSLQKLQFNALVSEHEGRFQDGPRFDPFREIGGVALV